ADIDVPVWALLEHALSLFGHRPVLVERDANIPPFAELMNERATAQGYLDKCRSHTALVNAFQTEAR
ncbi:MAG: DUF692 family protein, partial [Amphritea sp.]|nr:DUF692 family protein [Amphritea sp.]